MILRPLRIATRFLSRLPVPGDHTVRPGELAASLAWHPLVGALIGGLMGLAALPMAGLPALLRGALLTALSPLLTGAMHEDALADAADGLGGGLTRERALEIMRDSRVGAYGAVAAAAAMLLRFAALSSIEPGRLGVALLSAYAVSRVPGVLLLVALPGARSDGQAAIEGLRGVHAAFALVIGAGLGLAVAGWTGLAALGLMLGVTLAWGLYCRQRIGGITGDLAGAANLLVELGVLVLFAGG